MKKNTYFSRTNEIARQGDVLLTKVSKASVKLNTYKEVPRENGRIVLAHGEVTGHSHAIHDTDVSLFMNAEQLDRILEVRAPMVTLSHEEHAEIKLPSGYYRVTQQQEYSAKAIRAVAD